MPERWPQVALGEILKERNETPDPALVRSGDIPIISKIRFSDGEIEYRTDSETNTKMILIHPGDLVLSGINAMKGAIAIYTPETTRKAAATIHYAAYQVNKDRADIRYLWWLLRSQYFQEILTQQVPQGIKTELKSQHFFELEIPLPPLDVQQRIAERILYFQRRVEEISNLQKITDNRIKEIIQSLISSSVNNSDRFTKANLSKVLAKVEDLVEIEDNQIYRQVTVHMHNEGLSLRKECLGKDIKSKRQFKIREGQFVFSKIDARNGAMGLVPPELDGAIVSSDFPVYITDNQMLHQDFFNYYSSSDAFISACVENSKGTSNRRRLNEKDFLQITISLPDYEKQLWIVSIAKRLEELGKRQEAIRKETEGLFKSILNKAFQGEL